MRGAILSQHRSPALNASINRGKQGAPGTNRRPKLVQHVVAHDEIGKAGCDDLAVDDAVMLAELVHIAHVLVERNRGCADGEQMIDARETARKNKDFAAADRIRDELQAKGIRLMDSPEGVKWERSRP